jgi:hypothetical protein
MLRVFGLGFEDVWYFRRVCRCFFGLKGLKGLKGQGCLKRFSFFLRFVRNTCLFEVYLKHGNLTSERCEMGKHRVPCKVSHNVIKAII